jgi:hypothetical protein
MPDVTQNVIIEFISDTTKLAPAVDQLENIGKIEQGQAAAFKSTNTEINKQAAALKNVAAVNDQISATGKVTKKNVSDLATAVKGMSGTFQSEFKKGVIDGLQKAGVSIKDFEKTLDGSFDKASQATLALRSQLRAMVEQLAQLKLNGQENSDQFEILAGQAAKLKTAINAAGKEVSHLGSETRTIDGVIDTVSSLAGGFAVVQGAAALFGDESEELQKTLLRVNAAMAILQGLQEIQKVLLKDSAASKLADVLATKAQAAALAVYNFVVGASTGLTKALRIALAATGVGLLVIGVLALVEAFKSSNNEMEDATTLIDSQADAYERLNEVIERQTNIQEARAKLAGASESELIRIQGRALQQQRAALLQFNKNLAKQRDELDATSEAWFKLNTEIDKNSNTIIGLDNQIVVKSINLEKQLADERAEAEKKRKADAKQAGEDAKKRRDDATQKEKDARAAGFADFKASVELELLAAEKGSQAELEIKKRLLRAELQQALDNDKLTDNQRKLLIHKFFSERIELEKQFSKDRDKLNFETIASGIQADLAQLEVSNEKKLELTETAIRLQAQVEIGAAEGNSAKIIEIEAKRDKAIRDARIASIQEVVNYEIALSEATDGPEKRRLQAILENGKTELGEKKSIIDELAGFEASAIQKRISALNKEKEEKLISQKDYDLQYRQLVDQQVVIWEDAEKKKTEETKKQSATRNEQIKKDIESVASIASAVSDVLSGINDIQTQNENNKLQADRNRIKELREAGAISEKDAVARMKRLDREELVIKRKQAQREKNIAIFEAIINTAKGVAAAIPNPFLIALAIAVGAAQIAIISARPLPQFAKGKKGSYEGLGIVGEAGSELVEKNGKMFIAEKEQMVWLGKKDKVYSHKETVEMMSKPVMSTERNDTTFINNKGDTIDYDKIGEAVGKHVQTNVFVDGVQEQSIRKKEFINYINNRRSF